MDTDTYDIDSQSITDPHHYMTSTTNTTTSSVSSSSKFLLDDLFDNYLNSSIPHSSNTSILGTLPTHNDHVHIGGEQEEEEIDNELDLLPSVTSYDLHHMNNDTDEYDHMTSSPYDDTIHIHTQSHPQSPSTGSQSSDTYTSISNDTSLSASSTVDDNDNGSINDQGEEGDDYKENESIGNTNVNEASTTTQQGRSKRTAAVKRKIVVDTDSSYHDDSDDVSTRSKKSTKRERDRDGITVDQNGVEYGKDGKPLSSKQQRRRQQNRNAAATSRMKRKMYVTNLETQVNELLKQQERIMEQVEKLKQENQALKQMAMKNSNNSNNNANTTVQQKQEVKNTLSSSSSSNTASASPQADAIVTKSESLPVDTHDGHVVVKSDMRSKDSSKIDVVSSPVSVAANDHSDVENVTTRESMNSVNVVNNNVDMSGVTDDALLPVCRTGVSQPPSRINVQPTTLTEIQSQVQTHTIQHSDNHSNNNNTTAMTTSYHYPVMNTLQRLRHEQQGMSQLIMSQAIQTVACLSIVWTLLNPFKNSMDMDMDTVSPTWMSSMYLTPQNSEIFFKIWIRQLDLLMPQSPSIMKYMTTPYNNKSIYYWHNQSPDYKDVNYYEQEQEQQRDYEYRYGYGYYDEESEVQLAKELSRISLLDETPDDFRREVEYRQMIANAA